MCIILDTNLVAEVFSPKSAKPGAAFEKLRSEILCSNGRIYLVIGGRLAREYAKMQQYAAVFTELGRRGTLLRVTNESVDAEEQKLIENGCCRSDDPHVIALARRHSIRLLCTRDRLLIKDFDDPLLISAPRGRIYSRKHHRRLLERFCHRAQRPTS